MSHHHQYDTADTSSASNTSLAGQHYINIRIMVNTSRRVIENALWRYGPRVISYNIIIVTINGHVTVVVMRRAKRWAHTLSVRHHAVIRSASVMNIRQIITLSIVGRPRSSGLSGRHWGRRHKSCMAYAANTPLTLHGSLRACRIRRCGDEESRWPRVAEDIIAINTGCGHHHIINIVDCQ